MSMFTTVMVVEVMEGPTEAVGGFTIQIFDLAPFHRRLLEIRFA